MLDGIRTLFRAKNSTRDAMNRMGRILSRHSMTRMIYDRELQDERRHSSTIYSSVGVWLFPGSQENLSVSSGIPAVTRDLRTGGIGIMSLIPVMTEAVVVAIPDEEQWTFLECVTRHKTTESGGWFQMGVEVTKEVRPASEAFLEFERRCKAILQAAGPQPA